MTMGGERGKLFVLSGPSGSGKSTLVARALAGGRLPVRLAVSATTRRPRPGEVEGIHYHFWTREQFDRAVDAGEFLEWEEVFGHKYGTLRQEVDPYLEKGVSVILEIDVKGAQRIKQLRPDAFLIFVRASSLEEYERRLRQRQTESDEEIGRRIAEAKREIAQSARYDAVIINDDLDRAAEAFCGLLKNRGGPPRVG